MSSKGIELNNSTFVKPKLQPLQLLKGVANIIKDSVTPGGWTSLPADIIDTITAIKLDEQPGEMGWKLISRSLVQALVSLIAETNPGIQEDHFETKPLDERLNTFLEKDTYYLQSDFFKDPKSFPLLEDIKPVLNEYLQLLYFEEIETQNILQRLNSYFVFALVNEWRAHPNHYTILERILVTPFNEVEKRETQWNTYFTYLENQINKPVFTESFSLKQVYIPLRAYYKERKRNITNKAIKDQDQIINKDENVKRIVVDLESHLMDWIKKGDTKDSIRIVRGGPGYGKSSFLKMLAAKLATHGKRVLFIPLHRLDIEDKLDECIKGFVRFDKYLTYDPINDDDEPLVLLFDGLDELSMQGKVLADIAQSFLREINRSISNYNSRQLKIQAIISGRDVIIQQNETDFRNDGQVLRLLPYYLTKEDKENLIDKQKLLKTDQRNLWWKKYGQVSDLKYKKLPKELKTGEIDEITAQPLLNFLVALSYQRKTIDFSQNTNLNTIYQDLLKAVYDRAYADGKKLKSLHELQEEHFYIILEEIAISVWHGKGRTTTIADIQQHFEQTRLSQLLSTFIKDAEKGVVSLLAAFYFRQATQSFDGSQTFEFTHKSFGEYLTAKAIIRKLQTIHKQLQRNKKDIYKTEGWTTEKCLIEWTNLFGEIALDNDLVRFIHNELDLLSIHSNSLITALQQTVVLLFNQVLDKDLPLEKVLPRLKSFQEEGKCAINSKKALLIINSSLASCTDKISGIKWPSKTSFGEFIGNLLGQRLVIAEFIMNFCNHLDINDQMLECRDFYATIFSKTRLKGSDLSFSILYNADLKETDLSTSQLICSNLEEANIEYSNLSNANLLRANLSSARLTGANLFQAILAEADLTRADLKNSNLKEVDLRYTNLRDSNLMGADLTEADLTGANLKGTNLTETKFSPGVLEKLKENGQI